jgi:ABC-type nitrate/sulfonate/bicarbonate transport system permease component
MHRSDRYAAFRSPVGRMVPLVVMGLIWQAVCATRLVDPSFLPSPLRIGHAMVDLLTGREIRDNLFVTLARAAIGLALGSAAGVWLGLMMARSPKFRAYAAPIVGGTYSLPKSALIPLFILWFGIGTATTVCAVFLACLLPMVVNTARARARCCGRYSCRTRYPIFSPACGSRWDSRLCWRSHRK